MSRATKPERCASCTADVDHVVAVHDTAGRLHRAFRVCGVCADTIVNDPRFAGMATARRIVTLSPIVSRNAARAAAA